MTYKIKLLVQAERDYARIYRFIKKRSEVGASNWAEAFQSGIDRLRETPLTCGHAYEERRIKRGLRQLLFGTKRGRIYRAIFLIDGEVIHVLRIRGPGQKPVARRDLPD